MGLMAEPEHFSELFVNQIFPELLFISEENIGKSPLLSFSFYPANQTTGGSCFASPCSCPPWELILNTDSLDLKVGCVSLSPPCATSTYILFHTGQGGDTYPTRWNSGSVSHSGCLLVLPIPRTFWDWPQTLPAAKLSLPPKTVMCGWGQRPMPFYPVSPVFLGSCYLQDKSLGLLWPNPQLPCHLGQENLCPNGLSSVRMPAHTCHMDRQK